jgi:hypothetical protein
MTAFNCLHGVIYYYLVDILSLLMRNGVVGPIIRVQLDVTQQYLISRHTVWRSYRLIQTLLIR